MSKTFTVENFKGVREITLSPTGSLVVIAGGNGAGKSSFIDAFVELFDPKGVRLTPKPIHEGEDEGRAEYTDTDLGVRIVRTWKKDDAGKLEVFALDGAKYSKPADVVASLTGGLIFDPVAFLNLDEKKQRDALLAKVDLPIDLDELAREKAGAEGRRLDAGREVKRLQGALSSLPQPPADVPDVEVSAAALIEEIQAAQDFLRTGESLTRQLADADANVSARKARVTALASELDTARAALEVAEDDRESVAQELKHWEETPEPPNLVALQSELSRLDETNAAVRAATQRREVSNELLGAEHTHAEAQTDLDAIEARKREALAAAKFPVAGLSVDEDGITFEGVPFVQVNSAARRSVAFAIATAGDPKLRLVIVKDGDLLDADSLTMIGALAEQRGYTVLVERDRDESRQIGFTIVDGALA